MNDKTLGLLGMMRRASAIAPGEDSSEEAVLAGKARLLLLSSDISDKARIRAERYVENRKTVLFDLPYTNEEIAGAIGIGGCAMLAVTDLGFANALLKLLCERDADTYDVYAKIISERFEKAERRKKEKPGPKAKKKQ